MFQFSLLDIHFLRPKKPAQKKLFKRRFTFEVDRLKEGKIRRKKNVMSIQNTFLMKKEEFLKQQAAEIDGESEKKTD